MQETLSSERPFEEQPTKGTAPDARCRHESKNCAGNAAELKEIADVARTGHVPEGGAQMCHVGAAGDSHCIEAHHVPPHGG